MILIFQFSLYMAKFLMLACEMVSLAKTPIFNTSSFVISTDYYSVLNFAVGSVQEFWTQYFI